MQVGRSYLCGTLTLSKRIQGSSVQRAYFRLVTNGSLLMFSPHNCTGPSPIFESLILCWITILKVELVSEHKHDAHAADLESTHLAGQTVMSASPAIHPLKLLRARQGERNSIPDLIRRISFCV